MKIAYINGMIDGKKQAFGVEQGQFIEINETLSLDTYHKVVDLKGKTIVPGFNDSHMHLLGLAQVLSWASLMKYTKSIQELQDYLRSYKFAMGIEDGQWIRGRGWNHDYFEGEHRLLERKDLDAVSTTCPMVMIRCCGHICTVNSKALEVLGIDENTPMVEGVRFDLEKGQFFENALSLIYDKINRMTKNEIKRSIIHAQSVILSHGITSVQTDDFTNLNQDYHDIVEAYLELEKEGKLLLKITQQNQLTTIPELEKFIENKEQTLKTPHYQSGPLKIIADGSLGARTAYLNTPYADDHSTQGMMVYSKENLEALIAYANTHQMGCVVHCIGDGALKVVLDIFKKYNPKDNPLRNGIVHCQITSPELLEVIKEYQILTYVQPIFLDYDLGIVNERVGQARASTSYAFKTLTQTTHTSGGSDCPVEMCNVLQGMYHAVSRKNLKGDGPYLSHEALTIDEALKMYTIEGAYASFEEETKGSIEVGKAADFVILSKPLTEDTLLSNQILETYINGKCAYQSKKKSHCLMGFFQIKISF